MRAAGFAENPNKVKNIAQGSAQHFAGLFEPHISAQLTRSASSQGPLSSDTVLEVGFVHVAMRDVSFMLIGCRCVVWWCLQQSLSPLDRRALLERLPLHVRRGLALELRLGLGLGLGLAGVDEDEPWQELCAKVAACGVRQHSLTVAPALRSAVASLVRTSSRGQSVKGLFTAGLAKSLVYAGAKLAKARI